MKKILFLIVLVGVFAVSGFSQEEIEIGGYFTPSKPVTSVQFKGLKFIAIDPFENDQGEIGGILVFGNSVNYKITNTVFDRDGKLLAFETEAKKGIHYVFSGKFKNFKFAEDGAGNRVLTGVLAKQKGRDLLGQIDLTFDFTVGE